MKKRVTSFVLSLAMVFSLGSPAFATENTLAEEYDWDYDLAMERGYLTHEDNLPEGVILNENEIFIPAQVPSPLHAQAKIASMQQNRAANVISRVNPASDPWDYYSWDYVGTIQSDTMMDVIIDSTGTLFFSTLFTSLGVTALIVLTYSVYDISAALLEHIRTYGTAMGYYNKYLYTARNPGDIPYIDYEITYFYTHPDRTPEHFIDIYRDWVFAVAP